MLLLSVLLGVPTTVDAASGSITGVVFRDFELNGSREGTDQLQAGVEVRVFDDAGNVAGPVPTGNDGSYTVDLAPLTPTRNDLYRVEFAIPANLDYLQPGSLGPDNAGPVQFVAAGGVADFAVHNPAQFCEANPSLAVTCWVNGQPDGDLDDGAYDADGFDALVTVPWDGFGTTSDLNQPSNPVSLADNGEIGTTWGLGYQRASGSLFVGAAQRRHAGFGPGGTGMIYQIDSGGVVSPFLDLDGLAGLNTGADPHTGLPTASYDPGNLAQGTSHDPASFDAVGKIGLGDIDISEDDQTLWTVGLADQAVVEIPIGLTPTAPDDADIIVHDASTAVSCSNGAFRPFALDVHDGLVYVGGVCTGEAAGGTLADVSAHVLTLDPDGAPGVFTSVWSMAMDYRSSAARAGNECAAGLGAKAGCEWERWRSDWNDGGAPEYEAPTTVAPQPMLTDIEIDIDGSLVLGFADRFGLQSGFQNYETNTSSTATYNGATGGDLVRVCNVAGTLTFPCRADGTEFYRGDFAPDPSFIPLDIHPESSWGATAMLYRSGEVAMTMADPLNVWSGGLGWLDKTTGEIALTSAAPGAVRRYQVFAGYDQSNPSNPSLTGIGKATGLGDLELICASAPIEVGDRVWFDRNANGTQDPSEPPLPGVEVILTDVSGTTELARTTTDTNGVYRFDSATTPALTLDTDFRLTFDESGADLTSIPDLADVTILAPTASNQGSDQSDSDIAADRMLTFTTGGAGVNDYSLDAGFSGGLQLGNLVWLDLDDNGDADAGEPVVEGVRLQIFREVAGAGLAVGDDELVGSTTTNADGNYSFRDLIDGESYYVAIPEDQSSTTIAVDGSTVAASVLMSSSLAGAGPDNNDDGDAAAGFLSVSSAVIVSNAIGTEPTGELDVPPDPDVDAEATIFADTDHRILDDDSNLTVDFGFTAKLRVGNLVWFDQGAGANIGDGVAQADEVGLTGVVVELWNDVDGDGSFEPAGDDATGYMNEAATDGEGNYVIDQLEPDRYFLAVPVGASQGGGDNSAVLDGLVSSAGVSVDAEAADNDDDGDPQPSYVAVSAAFDLGAYDNSTGEADSNLDPSPDAEAEANAAVAYLDRSSQLVIDFALVEQLRLGGIIWADENGDSPTTGDDSATVDPGESGMAGVLVQLMDTTMTPLAETVTDADGAYFFENLAAGSYLVGIPADQSGAVGLGGDPLALIGFVSSQGTNGAGSISATPETADNDDDGDPAAGFLAKTEVITLSLGGEPTGEQDTIAAPSRDAEAHVEANGARDLDDRNSTLFIDLGFITQPSMSVGNRVWADWNDDGVHDPVEPGLPDVDVEVWPAAADRTTLGAVPTGTATTDADGYWLVDGIDAAGDYVAVVPASQFAPVVGPLAGWFSSNGSADAATDTDENDDGIDPATSGGDVVSEPFTLEFDAEPTGSTAEPDKPTGGLAFDNPSDEDANMTVDFGFTTYSVGSRVWFDSNRDGVQDAGEPGIPDVVVQLVDGVSGSAIDATVTDADGDYLFIGISADSVEVVIPAGEFTAGEPLDQLDSVLTAAAAAPDVDRDDSGDLALDGSVRSGLVPITPGTAPSIDDPDVGTNPGTNPLVVADGNEDLTIDFGFHAMAVGNRVFIDDDSDGSMDGAEIGRSSVDVELWAVDGAGAPVGGSPVAVTQTDADGYYLFIGPTPGDYLVRVPSSNFASGGALFGYVSSAGNGLVAPDPDDLATDSDDNGTGDVAGFTETAPFSLAAGDEPTGEPDLSPTALHPVDDANTNLTIDLGFTARPGLSLGNRVWFDLDGNRVIDAGEAGVDGVRVELWEDDTFISFDVTNNEGYYLFPLSNAGGSLIEGDYRVEIPASNFDEPTDPLFGWFSSPDPAGGAPDPDLPGDAGIDDDDNGIDPVVPFGPVTSGPVTLSDQREPLGETDVEPPGTQASGDENTNLTVDFGFTRLALGSTVFFDTDADGLLTTATDVGIEGVELELLTAGLVPVIDGSGSPMTTSTDVDGSYLFVGMPEGEYVVSVSAANFEPGGPLAGTFSSPDPATGPDDPNGDGSAGSGVDNDDNGIDAVAGDPVAAAPISLSVGGEPLLEDPTTTAVVGDGSANLTVDFGFTALSLGTTVWLDEDGDGTINGAELGIAGVPLELWTVDGDGAVVGVEPLAVTQTDADGNYFFDGLDAGEVIVRIPAPAFVPGGPLDGFVSTSGNGVVAPDPDDVDLDADDNGDPDPVNGWVQSPPVTLDFAAEPVAETTPPPGSIVDLNDNGTVDFGFIVTPPLSLGNRVFFDANNSGSLDPDESGLAGVAVELVDPDTSTVVDATQTDADGYYLFEDLEPATYLVQIAASNFASSEAPLYGFGSSTAFVPTDPDDDPTDSDDEGFEPAVLGEAVVSAPVSLYPSLEPDAVDELDVPAVGGGSSADIDSNLTVDFGFYPLSVGNRVWADLDDSGSIDADEPGIGGVTVELIARPSGTAVASTFTDADGYYLFAGVAEGQYVISIPAENFAADGALAERFSSTGNELTPAPGDGVDSDDNGDAVSGNGSAVVSRPFTLDVGAGPTGESDLIAGHNVPTDASADLTVDFGFMTLTVGDIVWMDADNDGLVDADESGAPGVTVELIGDSGAVIDTTTTDENGRFELFGPDDGSYRLRLPSDNFEPGGLLDGFISSTGNDVDGLAPDPNDGVDDDDNGDRGEDGAITTRPVALSTTADEATSQTVAVDLGLIPGGSIGSVVFRDENGNGQRDGDEPGIEGVTVRLIDAAGGDVLAEVVTDADGAYLFDGLAPGSYVVEFVPPAGLALTIANVGSDGSDSDADPTSGRTGVIQLALGEDVSSVYAGLVPIGLLAFSGSGMVYALAAVALSLVAVGGAAVLWSRRRKLAA